MKHEDFNKRVPNYLNLCPHTKGISSYGKDRIVKGLASLLRQTFRSGQFFVLENIQEQLKRAPDLSTESLLNMLFDQEGKGVKNV